MLEFPFAFVQAFGNKETTLKRLRKGESNKSDLGGVLQTNNIHNNGDLAYFTTWCPAGTSIKTLVKVEGHRWAIEDSFETAKNEFGHCIFRSSSISIPNYYPRALPRKGNSGRVERQSGFPARER